MIPIYEQGEGRGIGHSIVTFSARFNQICEEHIASGRATTFAFIFYDHKDGSLKRILKSQQVFTMLDRLSRDRLSVFYLHNPSDDRAKRFNRAFQDRLGVSSSGPCIVFFRFDAGEFRDVSVCAITTTDVELAFHEVYEIVSKYLAQDTAKPPFQFWRSFGAGAKWVSKEAITALAKDAIDQGKVFDHLRNFLNL